MKILIVDDDKKLRSTLRTGLEESGLACSVAADAEEARERLAAANEGVDLILLDVMMPGESGWEFLEQLRASGDETPVIFLTARHEVDERVKGLGLGADDYIIKPFDFAELMARIGAVERRRKALPVIEVGDLRIEPGRRQVDRGGKRIEMSPREFDVLHALAENAGQVLSRTELLRRVWNVGFDPGTNLVNVTVARLRRKLSFSGPPLVETVVGEGYRLVLPEASKP